jgi:hypothetical protein
LMTPAGPAKQTSEHAKLKKDMSFSYRSLLGELLYAYRYITARPDIQHWLCNNHPHQVCYCPCQDLLPTSQRPCPISSLHH